MAALLPWLAGLALDETAVRVLERGAGAARAEIPRLLEDALRRAVAGAVRDTVTDLERRPFATDAVLERILVDDLAYSTAGSASAEVLSTFTNLIDEATRPLWELCAPGTDDSHAEALGITVGHADFVWMLTDEFVSSIGLVAPARGPLAGFVALLAQQLAVARTAKEPMPARTDGTQAREVAGWVALSVDPPEVVVVNNSGGPIFDVEPVPALIAFGSDGQVLSMVGQSPLGVVRQIDPRSMAVWPMHHCRGWGLSGDVRGQLHFAFSDHAGRRWRFGHDHIWRVDPDG